MRNCTSGTTTTTVGHLGPLDLLPKGATGSCDSHFEDTNHRINRDTTNTYCKVQYPIDRHSNTFRFRAPGTPSPTPSKCQSDPIVACPSHQTDQKGEEGVRGMATRQGPTPTYLPYLPTRCLPLSNFVLLPDQVSE